MGFPSNATTAKQAQQWPPPSPSPAPLAGKAHAPWREVILLAGLSLFGSVAMDMYLPALPAMSAELHAATREGQLTISIFLLGLAAGQLIYGPLSDRIGRRGPILFGVVLFLAASVLCAFVTDVRLLIAARLLQALGACAGMVVARAVVRDRYDDHEVLHVFALLSLVFAIGPVAAPLIGGWVLLVANWRWIFWVEALFGLVVGVIALWRLEESRSEATRLKAESGSSFASYIALLREPLLVGYLSTSCLSASALFAYLTSAPAIVMGELHVPPQHFGWVFGVNAIGMTGAAQVNARLARRVSGDVILHGALWAALAAGLVLCACAWTGFGGAAGVLLPMFVMLTSLGFSQPNSSAAAMTVDRERAGATSALLGFSFFGVGALSGAVASLIPGKASFGAGVVVVGSLRAGAVRLPLPDRAAPARRGRARGSGGLRLRLGR